MQYIITTTSTFENVYVVDAPDEDTARDAVMNDGNPPDFYQRHLGERVTAVDTSTQSYADAVKDLRDRGYF